MSSVPFPEAGDAEIVQEVLTVFQTDTATRLESLQAAAAASDMPRVKSQAHSIKGSAGQVGAIGMAALCQRIEQQAGQGAQVAPLVGELTEAFARVCQAIAAEQELLG